MLCPTELAILVNLLAIAIADGKSFQELNTLAVVFTQLADTIATIALQKDHIEEFCESKKDTYESENINLADL